MNPRKALITVGAGLAAGALTLLGLPSTATDATWYDAEHVQATLTAGVVAPPQNLHCSDWPIAGVRMSWESPSGGVTRTGYSWAVTPTSEGGPSGSGTLDSDVEFVRLGLDDIDVDRSWGTGRFELWATGPGSWTSQPVTTNIEVWGKASGHPLDIDCDD